MSEPREQIESLHQQASTQYLQGEYGAAIATWRELLKLDPQDERAREGMRLCHMLAQAEPPAKTGQDAVSEPDPAGPADTTAIDFGLGEELDQSLERLDEVLEPSPETPPDWMDAPHRPASTEPPVEMPPETEIDSPGLDSEASGAPETSESPSSRTVEAEPLFDLSLAEEPQIDRPPLPSRVEVQVETTASPPSENSPPAPDAKPEAGAELKIDPAVLGIEDDSSMGDAADDSLSPTQAAEAELQHRINELMAEAMQCYERGEREQALAVLARLAILDESNEAAQTFAEHIRSECEKPPAAEPVAQPEEFVPTEPPSASPTVDGPVGMELGDTIDLPQGDALELSEQPPSVDADDPIAPLLAEGPVLELTDRELGQLEAEASRARRKPPVLVLAAVGVVGIVIVALVGLRLFGGSSETSAPAVATPAAVQAAVAGGAVDASADPGAPPAPVPIRADLPRLLEEGRDAFRGQDYAASILAFNQVLEVEPDNAEARDSLAEAVELYRAEKERLVDRTKAIEAFNSGDFRNALRLFYRLTPDGPEDQAKIERYMCNGWYNLAVRALASGECRTAREHLKEARQFDAEDPDIDIALGLADQCARSRPDSYYREVASLLQRGLGD